MHKILTANALVMLLIEAHAMQQTTSGVFSIEGGGSGPTKHS